MHFTKMQGAGNDFIILDNRGGQLPEELLPAVARRLCTPHLSLGADGLMVVTEAENADYGMLFFNSDGTMGEMCGNGARCIARWGYEKGLAGEEQHILTTAGPVIGHRVDQRRYRVRLNDPSVIDLHRPAQGLDTAYLELGDPGIPHAVVLMPEWESVGRESLFRLGRALRADPAYPKGANVTFVKLLDQDRVKAITFERGVEDFTLACGTGCGSVAAALTLLGLVSGREVAVSMPGGELSVSLCVQGDWVRDIFLTGPTTVVCEGEISGEALDFLPKNG